MSRKKPSSEPSPSAIIGFGVLLLAGGIGLAWFVVRQVFFGGAPPPNNIGDWIGAILLIAFGGVLIFVGGLILWNGIFGPSNEESEDVSGSTFQEECQLAEQQLGFPLPRHYLQTLEKMQLRLRAAVLNPESGIGINEHIAGGAAATPLDVVSVHGSCEAAAECVEEEFTQWLSGYVAIADDGGGGFYFVRKDSRGGVFMMDSDWLEEPREVSPTIESFLNQVIDNNWP